MIGARLGEDALPRWQYNCICGDSTGWYILRTNAGLLRRIQVGTWRHVWWNEQPAYEVSPVSIAATVLPVRYPIFSIHLRRKSYHHYSVIHVPHSARPTINKKNTYSQCAEYSFGAGAQHHLSGPRLPLRACCWVPLNFSWGSYLSWLHPIAPNYGPAVHAIVHYRFRRFWMQ